MEIHVYLHKNGGFPNIHKNSTIRFIGDEVIIQSDDMVVREYDVKDVFRVDILMETE